MASNATDQGAPDPLRQALKTCTGPFLSAGAFSMAVNLLMLTTSIYMMQVFDRVLAARSTDTLLFLTLIALGALAAMALLEIARGRILARSAAWLEQSIGAEAFARAIEAQLRGRSYRGEALRDLAIWRGWLASPGMIALYDLPWVPVYLGVVFLLHPSLGWLAAGGAAVLFLLTLANEGATAALLRQANTVAMTSQRRADSVIRNAEVIDSMGMMGEAVRRWQEGLSAVHHAHGRAADRTGIVMGATRFVRLGVQTAVLGMGALLVLENALTAGAMIAGSIIMGRALAPVEQMIGAWKQLVSARQSRRRLAAHLSAPRLRPPGIPLPAPTGRLVAERVSYAVPGGGGAIIKGVSFALEPGESVAVIGPSAAGKTTLVRLLIGVLEPVAGTVRLDGADVCTWLREDFGRHVGYLPQDVELFDGMVIENIARMGEPGPDAVFEAAKRAGCHEMILALPKGYETEIGDGGVFLSGGQRQLIGLARALYRAPKLVVLDEPNSNLDGEGEAALLRALATLKAEGTTVVLVSHRPNLVQGVDKVLVLREGTVEMFGPRIEVLKRLIQPARSPAAPVPVPAPARLDDRRTA
jgi:ATP-binding cassette subfamily C protein/ATP-binding cassette subfamily C protein EexD